MTRSTSSKSSTKLSSKTFEWMGDRLNALAFIINLVMTSAAMLRVPKGAYDESWLKVGFCVDQREDRTMDTGILCFVTLTLGAVGLFFFYQKKKLSMTNNKLLQHRMEGTIFSNLSHGFGHLFLQYTDGMVPPLEFSFQLHAMAWILVLIFFFFGVFRAVTVSVSNKQAFMMAVTAILVQKILDVPPELSFTYSQAVIFAALFIDQLLLPSRDKQGFTYLANALYFFPLFGFYYLESTRCSTLVKYRGLPGHALYDFYLAAAPFLFYYAIQHHEGSRNISKVKKT